jgi:peptidoglycan/LPS O-acetylase OafA/YrhL
MKIYFKGLDTLRAIAALIVVIGHIELLKKGKNIPNLFLNLPDGHIAVVLFFVISGFLITYLLVKERENNGQISFRKFYMRRILRIWPLYYTILILSFFLFRVEYETNSIVLSFTIFPNIAHALNAGWPTSPQIWSIGVEEQFYLFWPLFLVLIPEKRMIFYLLLFFFGYSLIPHIAGYINVRTIESPDLVSFVNKFFYGTKFNSMSIGALFGFLYAKGDKVIPFFYKNYIAYPSIILSFLLWFFGVEFKYFTDEFYSILFSVMILNITTNKNLKFNIDSKLFSFLGRISYGIYMYHWIIILLTIKYIPFSAVENLYYYNLVLYLIVLTGTIFISWISHLSLEKYFLGFKKHYDTK